MMNLIEQIAVTRAQLIRELAKTKGHTARRTQLELRLQALVLRQLRYENRIDRRKTA
jgi:hypothetical protein